MNVKGFVYYLANFYDEGAPLLWSKFINLLASWVGVSTGEIITILKIAVIFSVIFIIISNIYIFLLEIKIAIRPKKYIRNKKRRQSKTQTFTHIKKEVV